jgi:hypothetical protein
MPVSGNSRQSRERTSNQDRHAAARYRRNFKQSDDQTRKVRELACLGLQGADRTAVGYCCETVAARHYNRLVSRELGTFNWVAQRR